MISPDVTTRLQRVLVVDDERRNRDLLEVILSAEPFTLELAGSGEEALAMIASDPPDLVLLDVMMPGLDGYQVTARIKSNPLTKNIPVILITALDGQEARVLGLSAGAEDFLSKPVDRAELCVRVRNLLRLKSFSDEHDKYSQRLEREVVARTVDLRESARLYRSTFDAAPVGIIHVGLDGRWLRVNERMCELLGYGCAEILDPQVQALIHSEDGSANDGVGLHGLLEEPHDRLVIEEQRYRRSDGSVLWARINMSLFRDVEGNPLHVIQVVEDIGERRALEGQAHEREERFRKLSEASFDAIVTTRDGLILEINRGFLDIFGYGDERDVIGRPMTDFCADESREDVRRRMIDHGEGSFDLTGAREDGKKLFLEATTRAHTIDGGPARITAFRDVTDKRLLEDQFRQAQKMDAVGRLAGGVAHDFNNLLMIITGYSDLMLQGLIVSDPRRQDLEQIRKAADAAASLTRQLLAFSRQQVIEPTLVVLEDVVTVSSKMLERLIGEDIELVTQCNETASTILIDPGQLEQVIMNLVINARDAMPTGGVLTVATSIIELTEKGARAHWSATAGRFARLSVNDTGIGMDESTRARIFEPFFTTKDQGKGTGLGLATVYGIVEQSGGFIAVDSRPDQGATFTIHWPLMESAADAGVTRPTGEFTPIGLETILLVEDSDGVRDITRRVLQRQGYKVIEAPSGRAALDMALAFSGEINMLLTDVVMPEMSGRVLAERFAKQRPKAKLLYMSGYTDDAVIRHGVRRLETPYLQKPFSPHALASKVREVLDLP